MQAQCFAICGTAHPRAAPTSILNETQQGSTPTVTVAATAEGAHSRPR